MVNRGIERRAIFRAEGNYEHFLQLLAKAAGRFAVRVHGYVRMGTHYHLQLETPRANLSKALERRLARTACRETERQGILELGGNHRSGERGMGWRLAEAKRQAWQ